MRTEGETSNHTRLSKLKGSGAETRAGPPTVHVAGLPGLTAVTWPVRENGPDSDGVTTAWAWGFKAPWRL